MLAGQILLDVARKGAAPGQAAAGLKEWLQAVRKARMVLLAGVHTHGKEPPSRTERAGRQAGRCGCGGAQQAPHRCASISSRAACNGSTSSRVKSPPASALASCLCRP